MRKIIAGLEIGSNTIKLVVGEYNKNNLYILCCAEVPSKGVKRGLISNREELIPVLKETFHKAEEMLGIPIKEVALAIPAYYTESVIAKGETKITNEEGVVTYQDLMRIMRDCSYQNIEANNTLVDVIPVSFKINDEEIVKNPINMVASKLSMKGVLVSAPKSIIESFEDVLARCGVKVINININVIGDYKINRCQETTNKVGALINIGEDTTTVAIFNKGIFMKAEVLDLGGKNIDNDIAYIYKITKKDARELKESIGLATKDMARSDEIVVLTDRMGEEISINQESLSEIIESRLEEILNLAKKQINLLTKKDIDYIIITGGTSELGDFNILLDKVFTKRHILGKIEYIGVRNNKYSSVIGTIKDYNEHLRLRNKEYSVFTPDELETLSGAHKKVNINEGSLLGKIFGYFFDN